MAAYNRTPSVAHDHKFPQHPAGYSFSETLGSRIEPTFVRMQYASVTNENFEHDGRGNAFVYQRAPFKGCKDLRSMSIACIVYGILMIGFTAGYYGVRTNPLLELLVRDTYFSGFWGGAISVVAGIVALVGDSKAKRMGPLTPSSHFVAFAAIQLVALVVTTAAAILSTVLFKLGFIQALLYLDTGMASYTETMVQQAEFYLGLFNWVFAWGPVGCLLWTFRHLATAAIDAVSL